jgi:hypothetical protein
MALKDLEGKWSFQKVLGVFVELCVSGEFWRERTGALAKFQNFLGILKDFWSVWSGLGPICKYFSKIVGLAVILSYPVPRKREQSLHTCAQDVQITRIVTIW